MISGFLVWEPFLCGVPGLRTIGVDETSGLGTIFMWRRVQYLITTAVVRIFLDRRLGNYLSLQETTEALRVLGWCNT